MCKTKYYINKGILALSEPRLILEYSTLNNHFETFFHPKVSSATLLLHEILSSRFDHGPPLTHLILNWQKWHARKMGLKFYCDYSQCCTTLDRDFLYFSVPTPRTDNEFLNLPFDMERVTPIWGTPKQLLNTLWGFKNPGQETAFSTLKVINWIRVTSTLKYYHVGSLAPYNTVRCITRAGRKLWACNSLSETVLYTPEVYGGCPRMMFRARNK